VTVAVAVTVIEVLAPGLSVPAARLTVMWPPPAATDAVQCTVPP